MGGALDDEQFLRSRGLGVKFLTVPQRARFAARDDQERLCQQVSTRSNPVNDTM